MNRKRVRIGSQYNFYEMELKIELIYFQVDGNDITVIDLELDRKIYYHLFHILSKVSRLLLN